MTSSGRRKKHGLATEKSTGRGTAPTVAKNMGYRRKKHHQCKKHGLPSQKTCPPTRTVAKNTRHRCKKHLPREPSQKTRKLATVAKNMSYRRKKHATHFFLVNFHTCRSNCWQSWYLHTWVASESIEATILMFFFFKNGSGASWFCILKAIVLTMRPIQSFGTLKTRRSIHHGDGHVDMFCFPYLKLGM